MEGLDQRRLFASEIVLIVPHTHRAQTVISAYVNWVEAGRPERRWETETLSSPSWDPNAPDPIRYTRLVPIDTNFRVTGLVSRGKWRSPDDLEAARSLLEARFDLQIGLWDLVKNPLLRRTLLESVPAEASPGVPARVPSLAAQRAQVTVEAKAEQRRLEAAALEAIRAQATLLRECGWMENGAGSLLRLPLTEPIRRWPETDPIALVWLSIIVVKRQTSVSVTTVMYNDVDLQSYVRERRQLLEQVAAMELPGLDKMWPVLWRADGGWGDEIDWRSRFAALADKSPHWIQAFSGLVAECRRIHNSRMF